MKPRSGRGGREFESPHHLNLVSNMTKLTPSGKLFSIEISITGSFNPVNFFFHLFSNPLLLYYIHSIWLSVP